MLMGVNAYMNGNIMGILSEYTGVFHDSVFKLTWEPQN